MSARLLSWAFSLAIGALLSWSFAKDVEHKTVPCKYEENCDCAVPGITLRWNAAYCMALEKTDDLEQPGVQHCVGRPDPDALRKLTTCEQNRHWKTMICRAARDIEEVSTCVDDNSYIPRLIEEGPGS